MKALIVVVCLLLAGNLFLGVEDRRARIKAEAARKNLIELALAEDATMSKAREQIFSDLRDAMNHEETKSIHHQIFHVNQAQLKMQDLAVQEHQLLLRFMAHH